MNPITAAKTNAELILRRSDTPEPSALSARRIRAGEALALQFAPGDLDSMIREVIDEMAIVHGDRFTLDSDGPSEGSWDRDAIRRAVENLIGNAIKY
jgi:signal transduction histidine kinase